ncbi:MAG TPA: acyl-CoA dehydrogenase family protein, partial [Mycobacteriales bacterium]|nr:acyl-CoA dehydrogenase family protein [Mycobacteriales bacterium]
GPEAGVPELASAVGTIASYCASSGLVLAMHHIQVASIVRHASPSLKDQLLPRIAAGEVLLANANSEIGLYGNRRNSICALEPTENGFRIDKQASTVSYGEYADGVLATARQSPDAQDHEQALAICLPPHYTLEPTGDWDTLGLRGTCSRPARLQADLPADHVITDYATLFARTSLPVSTILLSSVWWGLAEAAARRAHASVRAAERKARTTGKSGPPLGGLRLAEMGVKLQQIRDAIAAGAADFEAVKDTEQLETLGFSSRVDNIKLTASTLVIDVVMSALQICGLGGYKNNTPTSMGRLVRDAVAAPLMVSNDRALFAMAQSLLVRKEM